MTMMLMLPCLDEAWYVALGREGGVVLELCVWLWGVQGASRG
jgi:hypothetical protein